MKNLSPLIAFVTSIILAGIWLGTLQSKANTTEQMLDSHVRDQAEFTKDLYEFMGKTREDLAVIKSKLDKRNGGR